MCMLPHWDFGVDFMPVVQGPKVSMTCDCSTEFNPAMGKVCVYKNWQFESIRTVQKSSAAL
jgi:hypothetical protein